MNNNISKLKGKISKKAISTMLAGSLIFSAGGGVVESEALSLPKPTITSEEFQKYNGVKIFINGRLVEFNDSLGYPTIINGRTYIPLVAVAQTFNANVYYNSETKEVYISKYGRRMDIKIGSKEYDYIDNMDGNYKIESKTMEDSTLIINDRTYVPLRVVFETFDAKVTWIGKTSTVIVENDYEKNTEYIDFKGKKMLNINEIDPTKYSDIIYDGEVITSDYLNVIKNSNQYKIIEDNGKLYIFSYQYLYDLNYIYKAHTLRKNDTREEKRFYKIYNIGEEEIDFIQRVDFINGYLTYYNYMKYDSVDSGLEYSLRTEDLEKEFKEVDKIVDPLVSDIKSKTTDPEEMVRLVNNYLCKRIKYIEDDGLNTTNLFSALLDGQSVCDGYALSFKYIMDKLEIPCIVCGGINTDNIPHGFNQVFVNGEWKIVDVTFNDTTNNNKYLLLSLDDKSYKEVLTFKESIDDQVIKLTLELN